LSETNLAKPHSDPSNQWEMLCLQRQALLQTLYSFKFNLEIKT